MKIENCKLGTLGKQYKTIVIDPPWPGPNVIVGFDNRVPAGRLMPRRLTPYHSMTGVQIAALCMDELATEDAQLWIWTTSRNLGDAYLLPGQWGFNYAGLIIWHKRSGNIGLGRCIRHQCEFLLWCRRKGARLPAPKETPVQVMYWKRTKGHSVKPAEAYEMIRKLTDEPRIDIFARQHRPGFEPWGNEVGKYD